jgi:perosamine synthetase
MDFFSTYVSERSATLAAETLRSGLISEGRRVREFEARLASELGLSNPTAVNSGTAALHLALDVAGVGPGDEVILPAQTFIATGLVIVQQHAVPVFADIDPETGNICPVLIERKLTSRTRAIMPVHWGGYPCDMDEINAIADRNGLAVIEDAAHALGAVYRGRPIGSISRFTAFSFQAIKHLTTGDGGALCCRNAADAKLAFKRRWFGIDRVQDKADLLGERVYCLDAIGYKYHMNDLAAAVGLGNLDTFAARLARRREIANTYRSNLSDISGLSLLRAEPDRLHAYWLFTILVSRREDFIRKLASHGVPASVVHLRIDKHHVLGGIRQDLPNQDRFDAMQVALPLHEGLSPADVEKVVTTIRGGW